MSSNKLVDEDDSKHLDPRQKRIVNILMGVFTILHVCGMIVYSSRRLKAPEKWDNPLYSLDKAYVFYHVHAVAFVVFMYVIGPLYVLVFFKSPQMRMVFYTSYVIASLQTVVPLLPVQKSKETIGTAAYLAGGVASNAAHFFFFLALVLPSRMSKLRPRQSWYLAFLCLAGYNVVVMILRYSLVDEPGINAIWHWFVFFLCAATATALTTKLEFGPTVESKIHVDAITGICLSVATIAMLCPIIALTGYKSFD